MMLLLATLGAGCAGTDTDTAAASGPTDDDGDGVYTPDDCDDTRADVYPGAPIDHPGDGVDADCAGDDDDPYEGCAPIDVPDVYPTIEDAIAAGVWAICLGEGTFTPVGTDDGESPTGLYGQGRGRTTVHDPAAPFYLSVLEGLTATGVVANGNTPAWTDVTIEGGVMTDLQGLICTRCALVDSPILLEVEERFAAVYLEDSWVTEADAGVRLVTSGCGSGCGGYSADVRMNNTTWSGNRTAFSFEITGNYDIFLDAKNSIFSDQTESVLEVTLRSGGNVYPSGERNLVWNSGVEHWPDGAKIQANERDPELDFAYRPPRPTESSPAIDAGSSTATTTDFWGLPREAPDRGAVEY